MDQAKWMALKNAVAATLPIPTGTELTSTDGAAGDEFAYSVALSGTTALVGVPQHPVGSNTSQGAAYVFTSTGGTWVQQEELTANDGASSDMFGFSVAMSSTTALVGAPQHFINSNGFEGAAYVFTFNGSTWVQQQELTGSDSAAYDHFGGSVALSAPRYWSARLTILSVQTMHRARPMCLRSRPVPGFNNRN